MEALSNEYFIRSVTIQWLKDILAAKEQQRAGPEGLTTGGDGGDDEDGGDDSAPRDSGSSRTYPRVPSFEALVLALVFQIV